MANLIQSETSLTYYQGWYGTLSETGSDVCESFPLLIGDISSPLKILETRADSKAQNSYIGTLADGPFLTTQGIKELLCGHSYLIILKKGADVVDISQFTPAHAGTSSYEYKIRATI